MHAGKGLREPGGWRGRAYFAAAGARKNTLALPLPMPLGPLTYAFMNTSKPCIHIEKARQHNLKNISLDIPRDELVVICGPSGSGKSTLAFDIVYAEGQRPLCGIAVCLRPPVFTPDGQAGRGKDRGAFARNLA